MHYFYQYLVVQSLTGEAHNVARNVVHILVTMTIPWNARTHLSGARPFTTHGATIHQLVGSTCSRLLPRCQTHTAHPPRALKVRIDFGVRSGVYRTYVLVHVRIVS